MPGWQDMNMPKAKALAVGETTIKTSFTVGYGHHAGQFSFYSYLRAGEAQPT